MKRVLVALLTFTVGFLAFDLLETTPVSNEITFTSEQKSVEVAEIQTLTTPVEIKETPKSFFDSFTLDEYDQDNYQGFNGWFIADEFKGMSEVWTILLSRNNENSKDQKLVWSAMVLTQNHDGSSNDDDNFQSVWIKTENNNLSFRTNKIRGIEYRFKGNFLKHAKEFSNDERVLKGTFRKMVRGKEVGKFTSEFSYHEPVCFH